MKQNSLFQLLQKIYYVYCILDKCFWGESEEKLGPYLRKVESGKKAMKWGWISMIFMDAFKCDADSKHLEGYRCGRMGGGECQACGERIAGRSRHMKPLHLPSPHSQEFAPPIRESFLKHRDLQAADKAVILKCHRHLKRSTICKAWTRVSGDHQRGVPGL